MARGTARPAWSSLPAALRSDVETVLGARVVRARSVPGGWSPGSADRIVLADGRRAFVKAASADVNAVTVALHRREAAVLEALSGAGAAPDLLAVAEQGAWFALVTEHVEGRHPDPSSTRDTRSVLDAVAALPDDLPPGLLRGEDDLQPVLEDAAEGWHRLLVRGADTVPGGVPVVQELAARSAPGGAAVAGDGVVHGDLRLDNVLIEPRGRARLVDWPSAGAGRAWFDGITYLLDARRLGGEPLRLDHPLFDGVDGEQVDASIAALAGYFFDAARRPADRGLEGIRAFQREQGLVLLDVLLGQDGGRY